MNQSPDIRLEDTWKEKLLPEFQKNYMKNLKSFLKERKSAGAVIFPKGSEYFSALNATTFENVKVVILGQDPYHGPGQAHGLSFSVKPGVPLPPSLKNIYKELHGDLGLPLPKTGYLKPWADQGVLLLNATLSVEQGQAGSHQGKGWEEFTDEVIRQLNEHGEHIVFLLWGSYAQKKGAGIDPKKHLVLKAPHPSPLSAHRGFLGCKHFSKTNEYLRAHGKEPIDWSLN
ncbi:MAG: uracil-DNA glycosylase [Bdellovibrionaceae bacterium]|nr:uracil-DNA glycosylase [Pseudobdellovibrionaceae bacterium]|tara:strand:+ start:398 stop:1084 length:687 start_codon:yes stop_codon:yes gene_type:complete